MIDRPTYYERPRKRWVPYDGERIALPGWRAVVADHKDFDDDGRVFAYAQPDGGGTFLAWHEVPEPGEVKDVEDGLYPTRESAQTAAIEACLKDLDKLGLARRKHRPQRGKPYGEERKVNA